MRDRRRQIDPFRYDEGVAHEAVDRLNGRRIGFWSREDGDRFSALGDDWPVELVFDEPIENIVQLCLELRQLDSLLIWQGMLRIRSSIVICHKAKIIVGPQ